MRPVLIAVGVIVLLMGTVWALQGAWIVPATFMRGPTWIGIGAAVALIGLAVGVIGFRSASPKKPALEVSPKPRA